MELIEVSLEEDGSSFNPSEVEYRIYPKHRTLGKVARRIEAGEGSVGRVLNSTALVDSALAKLDKAAHHVTKLRARQKAIDTIKEAIEQEFGVKIEDEEVGAQVLTSIDTLAEFVTTKTA